MYHQLSRRRRFFKLATFTTEVDFGPVRVSSVVGFARAVWCNIRGASHHSRAFYVGEHPVPVGLGLGFERIGRPVPAS